MVDSIRSKDGPGAVHPGQHIAHFYAKTEQMVQAACRYIAEGLRRGEAVIIVATRAHWSQMVGRLALKRGVDLVDAVMHGQLRHVDAEVALSALLDDGMPNDNRFHERVETVIEPALERFGRVRIMTELAGMLWEAGNRAAAIRLEELWNSLAGRLPFALLCTYRSGNCGVDGYNSALRRVYSAHSAHSDVAAADDTRADRDARRFDKGSTMRGERAPGNDTSGTSGLPRNPGGNQ